MDLLFEGISFNATHWLTKDEKAFAEACKAEGKFKGVNQDKLIKAAWKAMKATVKNTERPTE